MSQPHNMSVLKVLRAGLFIWVTETLKYKPQVGLHISL